MTDHSAVHARFTIERQYPVSAAQVFAAWADPERKRRWFARGDAGHQLDFRVGGKEVNGGRHNGIEMRFESTYYDIVDSERIVYASVLTQDGRPATVSLTTIELEADGEGTRLVLTEQGAFLDELEQPAWREGGTGDWLDALGREFSGASGR